MRSQDFQCFNWREYLVMTLSVDHPVEHLNIETLVTEMDEDGETLIENGMIDVSGARSDTSEIPFS